MREDHTLVSQSTFFAPSLDLAAAKHSNALIRINIFSYAPKKPLACSNILIKKGSATMPLSRMIKKYAV